MNRYLRIDSSLKVCRLRRWGREAAGEDGFGYDDVNRVPSPDAESRDVCVVAGVLGVELRVDARAELHDDGGDAFDERGRWSRRWRLRWKPSRRKPPRQSKKKRPRRVRMVPRRRLDSVRWGPDRREPEDTLESLDALAREHLGRPARVAGRLRARHNRDRISLAIVATVEQSRFDDAEDPDGLLGFGRVNPSSEEPEARPEIERRPVGDESDDRCRCDGDDDVELFLMRVAHAPTPQVATVELADVCSGLSFDARLLDFDGDGRIEVRVDFEYTGWESCGTNEKVVSRMAVFDVADLTPQVNLVLNDFEMQYDDEIRREARARFHDLDDDGDKDIEVRGIVVRIESMEETRDPVNERWMYDPTTDRWAR